MDTETNQVRGGIYLHYSGLMVFVLGIARHSETEEQFVTYIPLAVKEGPRITVRPLNLFLAEVEHEGKVQPRFVYIGDTMPTELASQYNPLSK